MISFSIFFFFLVQSSFANFEDSYSENPDNYNVYSEDFLDPDEGDIEKRDNHFMRFGRNSLDSKNKEYIYDEYEDPYVLTKRSGSQHIRYGRSGPTTFMRFGRDQTKKGKTKTMFMRMGRNFQDHEDKIRSKRSTPDPEYPKRKDHFMRFGKSQSFMRYGRDPNQSFSGYGDKKGDYLNQLSPVSPNSNEHYLRDNHPLTLLLAKLLARRQETMKPFDVTV